MNPLIKDLLPKPIQPKPPVPAGMRLFTVYRTEDETGVSGTGIIIQGCLFADGKCCIQWLSGPDPGDTQIKVWDRFLDTHIRSHPENKTIITFADGTQIKYPEDTIQE